MQKTWIRVALALVATVLLASACGSDDGSIDIVDARYRLAREDLGAAYFTVTNTTGDTVTLQAVSAEGVGRIELHESIAGDDGVMSMEPRPEGFIVEAGQTVTLEPGGKHLMLFDPTSGGEDLTFQLDFGDSTVSVVAPFDEAASAAVDDMQDMEGMNEMDETEDMDEMQDADS